MNPLIVIQWLWRYRQALLLAFLVAFAWWAFEQREARIEAELALGQERREKKALERSIADRAEQIKIIERVVTRVKTQIQTVQAPCLDEPMPDDLVRMLNASINTDRADSPLH